MQDAELLGNFVRAADAVIVEALVQLVISTAQGLLAMLSSPDASSGKARSSSSLLVTELKESGIQRHQQSCVKLNCSGNGPCFAS